jgi:hypothetical protein
MEKRNEEQEGVVACRSPSSRAASVLSLKNMEQVPCPARLVYKEGGHANRSTEGSAGADGC